MKTYKNMNSIDQCLRTLSQDWQALLHEESDTVCESNHNRTAGLTISTSQSQPWNILVDLKWQKILVMLKVKNHWVLTMENIIIYELKILKDLNKNALMFLYSFKISYLHYQLMTQYYLMSIQLYINEMWAALILE